MILSYWVMMLGESADVPNLVMSGSLLPLTEIIRPYPREEIIEESLLSHYKVLLLYNEDVRHARQLVKILVVISLGVHSYFVDTLGLE